MHYGRFRSDLVPDSSSRQISPNERDAGIGKSRERVQRETNGMRV
jgi:hypothetical protein